MEQLLFGIGCASAGFIVGYVFCGMLERPACDCQERGITIKPENAPPAPPGPRSARPRKPRKDTR